MDSADSLRAPGNDGGVVRRTSGRGPLSCAECRRLKLKCDRVWPCGPCQRRGCSAICPDGSLIAGKSNRFILADTKQLHERIEELSSRIRELEDALKAAHASPTPHPLLRDELLRLKAPLQTALEINDSTKWAGSSGEGSSHDNPTDMLGTLTVDETTGTSSYHGVTAVSDALLPDEPQYKLNDGGLGAIIEMPAVDPEHAHSTLWESLPPLNTALDLAEAFFTHASWMYDPVPREQMEDLVITLYGDSDMHALPAHLQRRQHARRGSLTSPTVLLQESPVSITEQDSQDGGVGTHDFALFYIVLAIGALVSPARAAFSPEADNYQKLSRIGIVADGGVMDEVGLTGIQTLLLMCYYLQLSDRKQASSNNWATLGLAAKLSQAIGLHRDSGKWKLQPAETQKRRSLFWELFTMDQLQSLGFGRPPSYILSHIDCEPPEDLHSTINNAGETEPGFHLWKLGFAREVLTSLIDQAFGAKPPAYNTIIMLDRVVRQYNVPSSLLINEADSTSIGLTMQRHAIQILKETSVLYLHRSFFARAVTEKPSDPLGSKFAPSVAAAVNSAMAIIDVVNNLFNAHMLTARFWFFWSHAFSASMVLGSYVTRIPGAQNAAMAMNKFDIACTMFHKASTLSSVAGAKALPIMHKLQAKARLAFQEWHTAPRSRGRPNNLSVITSPNRDDELQLFGVTTVRKPSPSPSRSRPISRSPSNRSRNASRNNSPLRSPHSTSGFDGAVVHSPVEYAGSGFGASSTGLLPSPGGLAPPSPRPFARSRSPSLNGGNGLLSLPGTSPGGLRPPSPGLPPGAMRPASPHLTPTAGPSSPGLTPIATSYWAPSASQFLGVDTGSGGMGSSTGTEGGYSSLAGWNTQPPRAATPRSHSRSRSEHVLPTSPGHHPYGHSHGHGHHGHGHSHSISEMPALSHSMSLSGVHGAPGSVPSSGLTAHHHPSRAHSLPGPSLDLPMSMSGAPPPPRIRTPQPEPHRSLPSEMMPMDLSDSHMRSHEHSHRNMHAPQPQPAMSLDSGLGLNTGMLGYAPLAGMNGTGHTSTGNGAVSGPEPGSLDEAYLAALMGGRFDELVGFAPGDQSLDAQWGKFVSALDVYQG